jgi:hypothetical protein
MFLLNMINLNNHKTFIFVGNAKGIKEMIICLVFQDVLFVMVKDILNLETHFMKLLIRWLKIKLKVFFKN